MHSRAHRVTCRLAALGFAALLTVACVATPALAGEGAQDDQADVAGLFAASGWPSAAIPATFSEDELDTAVGVYVYRGETYTVTAREAIEDSVSLASVLNADGTYAAPTADMVLTCARNNILSAVVAEEGIEVTEDELAAYTLSTIGTDDFAAIARYYGMDEDQARHILAEGACLAKLRDRVVGSISSAPMTPTAPADEQSASVATEEYAAYVIGLLGDAWDAQAGTWANTNNVFYQALGATEFDGVAATYEMAQIAYYVAYSVYQQQATEQLTVWTDYVNGYLAQASIAIFTLRS